jgi:hypothetical protein
MNDTGDLLDLVRALLRSDLEDKFLAAEGARIAIEDDEPAGERGKGQDGPVPEALVAQF